MKLRELKKGTKVRFKTGEIIEFLSVNGGFGHWKYNDDILIIGWAGQDISEYGEILDNNIKIDD